MRRFWGLMAFAIFCAMLARFFTPFGIWGQIFETRENALIAPAISADDAKAQAESILAEAKAARENGGVYTAEMYTRHQIALERIRKTMSPGIREVSIMSSHGPVGRKWTGHAYAPLLQNIQLHEIVNLFQGQPKAYDEGAKLDKLLPKDPEFLKWSEFQPTYTVSHWDQLAWHLATAYFNCVFLAACLFLVLILRKQCSTKDWNDSWIPRYEREAALERAWRIILDRPDHFFWASLVFPVGIFIYPNYEVLNGIRRIPRGVVYAIAALFSVFTGTASAQSTKKDSRKASAPYADISSEAPKLNSLALTFEGVDKYHGMAVGEFFALEPAPRILGRYTRTTSHGNFYVDSWNSMGRGFNNESDLGFGFTRSGFDVSYTHFFIRGADIGQASVAKSGSMKVGKLKVPLTANLLHYFRLRSTSPPTGTVFKLSSGANHKLPRLSEKFELRHRFALGVDDNPFGLGKRLSAIWFYTSEFVYKNFYGNWNATVPVAGRGNTSRGFRQSISAGYRLALAW